MDVVMLSSPLLSLYVSSHIEWNIAAYFHRGWLHPSNIVYLLIHLLPIRLDHESKEEEKLEIREGRKYSNFNQM